MKCNEVKKDLVFIPRNELGHEKKIDVMNHIQTCTDCRLEYDEYLKTFYLIDKSKAFVINNNLLPSFSDSIQAKINISAKKSSIQRNWLLAAISFSFIIFVFLLIYPFEQSSAQEKYSLKESLENEKWNEIYSFIETGKINDLKNEKIPVALILDKLESYSDVSYSNQLLEFSPQKIKKTKKLLKRYQRFQKSILVKDILDYYFKEEITS